MSQFKCVQCNGTGWLNCPECKGKGIYNRFGGFPYLPGGATVCAKCGGKGVLGKCEICNGTGRTDNQVEAQTTPPSGLELSEASYEFSDGLIRSTVERGRIGNYALGFSVPHADTKIMVFHPTRVGRSDTDLQEELLTQLMKKKPWYARFKFDYATTVREAFEKECREYHLVARVLDNEMHPEPPSGTDLRCPEPNCAALGT